VLTSLLLVVGVLSLTGISAGTTLTALGRAGAWAGGWLLWIGEWLLGQLQVLAERSLQVTRVAGGRALQGLGQLRASVSSVGVWRERRARRTRVQELREPEIPYKDEENEPVPEPEAPIEVAREKKRAAEPATRPQRGGEEPDIVDHDEERRSTRKPEQEKARAGSLPLQ